MLISIKCTPVIYTAFGGVAALAWEAALWVRQVNVQPMSTLAILFH